MILTAEELRTLPGRQQLQRIRGVLETEDVRIRDTQDMLVKAGFRPAPSGDQLAQADCFHAAARMLDHAIANGPRTTVEELTKVAREALVGAAVAREQADASAKEAGAAEGDGAEPQREDAGG